MTDSGEQTQAQHVCWLCRGVAFPFLYFFIDVAANCHGWSPVPPTSRLADGLWDLEYGPRDVVLLDGNFARGVTTLRAIGTVGKQALCVSALKITEFTPKKSEERESEVVLKKCAENSV